MLACSDTVTLIRCVSGVSYVCQTFSGVSWYEKSVISMEGSGVSCGDVVKIRIPAAVLDGAGFSPEPGDHIVRGTVAEVADAKALAALHPRRVMTVGNNLRGRFPHVAVIGQ